MSRFELCENSDQIKSNTSANGIKTGQYNALNMYHGS